MPQPLFLQAIYYDSEAVNFVFESRVSVICWVDFDLNRVVHYDNSVHEAPPIHPFRTGLDMMHHMGIDYGCSMSCISGAQVLFNFAGWSDPENHRAIYGLHAQMNHDDNADYRAWYGHLSVVFVETGDHVTADYYSNTERIIGISGNTGVYLELIGGNCPDVGEDPLCGAHLHFEVRELATNRPINPYGWVGPAGQDPWANYLAGATSYSLWEDGDEPAITTNNILVETTQPYPDILPDTEINYEFLIDNSYPYFTTNRTRRLLVNYNRWIRVCGWHI